jgi:aryl-alcohol dehydrogenase-like predicted oxidoreductase
MEQITIGKSRLKASRVGLGTWAIGGWMWGGSDETQAIATIRSAVERGMTLIDTAPVYGFGRSEEVVGKALAEGGLRDKVQIATKVGLAWKDSEVYRDSRQPRVRQEIEDSLRRLRTDVIDLYQVHWPDLETPIEETARALDGLRRQGKVRALGVSNFSPAQMDAFRAVAAIDAVQPPYNLFEREIEADVLPYAKDARLTVLSYGALCRGLLTGKITAKTTFTGDDLRKVDPKFQGSRLMQYLAAVRELDALARERSASRCSRLPSVGSSTKARPSPSGVRAGPTSSIPSPRLPAGRSMTGPRLTSMRSWRAASPILSRPISWHRPRSVRSGRHDPFYRLSRARLRLR